jgi:hypothetical protein
VIRRAALLLVGAALAAGAGAPSVSAADAPLRAGALTWQTVPLVFKSKRLPHDRVVLGRVRNTSDQTLELWARDMAVRDATGRRLRSVGAFTNTYAHGLFGAFQQPTGEPTREMLRLGRLAPGASAPFFAAWRYGVAPVHGPMHVDYGAADLALPSKVYAAAG